MARFRIQINEEADSLVIGSASSYGSEHVKISELDAFVGALRAAAAFAMANADVPAVVQHANDERPEWIDEGAAQGAKTEAE